MNEIFLKYLFQAMESESTDILSREWAQIEQVFHCEDDEVIQPEGMSEIVYNEVLLWRKAFNSKSKRSYNFNRNAKMSIRYTYTFYL